VLVDSHYLGGERGERIGHDYLLILDRKLCTGRLAAKL